MSEENAVVELPELEVCCSTCGGNGWRESLRSDRRTECTDCSGTGYVITEFGNKVLDFLERHYHLRLVRNK